MIEAKKPFVVLGEGLKTLQHEFSPFEPPQNGVTKPQHNEAQLHRPRWGTYVDDVRTAVAETSHFLEPVQQLLDKKTYTDLHLHL